MQNAAVRAPEATVTGIIVEKQMPAGGLEVLIGGKTDPSFGKVITFGLGGGNWWNFSQTPPSGCCPQPKARSAP